MLMKKVLNWKIYRGWIQVLPSTNISFSSFLEEEEENLPKLNPGLDQRKDPGGVATTWHSSSTWVGHCGFCLSTWGIVIFVFVLLLLFLLWGCLRCCYCGLCLVIDIVFFVLPLLLSLPSLSCYLYCYCGAVYVVVIVVLSLSLFEKVLEKSHRFSLFPQLDSGHRGDPGEFLHYSRNPAAIIVNNQVDHQSDSSDNSQ